MELKLDSLTILPHYQGCDLQGRQIPLIALYDESGRWQMWLPHEGKPHPFQGVPSEGFYFAKCAAKDSDFRSSFLELMFQQALWPDIFPLVRAIYSDINNLGASLAKADLIFQNVNTVGFGACRMVATELEYIFTVCRSIFDLIQETVANLWKKAQFTDAAIKKRQLPKSFQKMVYAGNTPVPSDEIAKKWSIPPELAAAYYQFNQFFAWLREYRSFIEHGGMSFDLIFPTDDGFAVATDNPPFSHLGIWCPENTKPGNRGSFRSAAALIVDYTLHALAEFGQQLKQTVKFPDEFAPNYFVYICGPFIDRISNVRMYLQSQPWCDPISLDLVPNELKALDQK